jgi:hypothetical protein
MNIVQICKDVLIRLTEIDCERLGGTSKERLIFPNKFPSEVKSKNITEKELLNYTRISEQELRFLFVEQFLKDTCKDFFYSVETPTEKKYRFGKTFEEIIQNKNSYKKSASIDMSVFKRIDEKYERILNIEFKHENGDLKNTAKDILKLVRETQNGVFIHLLKNTRRDTLCNKGKTGVFDKCLKSFTEFNGDWCETDKSIQLIIISLKEKTLIHRKIFKNDNLNKIFSFDDNRYGNIKEVNENEWKIDKIAKNCVSGIEDNFSMIL